MQVSEILRIDEPDRMHSIANTDVKVASTFSRFGNTRNLNFDVDHQQRCGPNATNTIARICTMAMGHK